VGLGLSSIHLCFCGLTIFLGCSLFYREIEQKTIYTLLVRPLHRWQYLFAKYLGLFAVLSVLLLGFMVSFLTVQMFLGLDFHLSLMVPFLGFLMESAILLALTFFLSSFCTPYVAISCSIAGFVVGHWIQNLVELVAKAKSDLFYTVGKGIIYTFPNLEALNWRAYGVARELLHAIDLSYGLLLTVSWTFFLLLCSVLIFKNKNFE